MTQYLNKSNFWNSNKTQPFSNLCINFESLKNRHMKNIENEISI